ncbi:MAG TPA: FlgD immunoglobulin-like domain containing protein [bacterium]|nr:FlgD immunoglobulin-like domain containing protein [bacterium]
MRRMPVFLVSVLALTPLATGLIAKPVLSTAIQSAPRPAGQAVVVEPARTVVQWDRFYDRHGNPLPEGSQEDVGTDSLYFKQYNVTDILYGCPKSQAPNPTPADCRPAFAWQNSQTVACMDTAGVYAYEVYNTNLRRTKTDDGTYTDYTIANGYWNCATDGDNLYVPVSNVVYKYTFTGTLVDSTALDITPAYYEFSVANDTVWCGTGSDTILKGYACSKFTGGSLTPDATWDVGAGTASPAQVAWDGQYYYVSWAGYASNTFKRFNPDRTLSASGTISIDTRGVMCRKSGYTVMICFADPYFYDVDSLGQMLADSSGGKFTAVDTYNIATHATFPATDWYNSGCRAILAFTNYSPADSAAFGDSLARFIQLGGGVVEAPFASDHGSEITGAWRSTYAPFTLQNDVLAPGTMGTIHQPLHPIMSDVTALYLSDWRAGNTPGTLRSANCVSLAEYTDSFCVAACFDSAGQRAASLGFYPLDYWRSTATGQWCRLLVNALNWTAVGPSVGVTAPNGGESWDAGTIHNITWTQTANGVSDSIYYSTDGGASWTGVTWFATPPAPLQYAWTVPFTPTTQARVKVVTWDGDGGRVEDKSDANFTIVAQAHDVGLLSIIQPVDTVDSGTAVVPTAVVKNFGGVQETFPVRFSIGMLYTHDTTVTIASGVTDTVAFTQWIAGPVGVFVVRCSTRLDADTSHANDRAMDTVVVKSSSGIAQAGNGALPLVFALHQPHPNPLATGAHIRYDLPRPTQVELRIYGVSGTLVRRLVGGAQTAGYRSAYWNGCDDRGRMVAPGVYYCRFAASDFRATQKLVVRR